MSRTVIDVRDDLLKKALVLSGLKKKVDVINLALKELAQTKDIRRILQLRDQARTLGDRRA